MAYSFGYWKQYQYLMIIKMQNVMYRCLEIHIIIEVMTL